MANKYVDGGLSSVIIGEETGGNVVTANADMQPYALAFNNWNVNEAEAPETNDALRASIDPSLPEDGVLSAEGTAQFPITLDRNLRFFQMATGDPAPVSTAQPDKVMVAAGTDVSDVVATDYFSATADLTVTVVSAGDLNSSPIAVTEDLGGYDDALTLTLTPSAAPSNDTTVTVNYTIDGVAGSVDVSFTTAGGTGAQTAALPADATITNIQSTAADWAANTTLEVTTAIATNLVRNPRVGEPGKLNFVLSDANIGGSIVIRGLRRTGLSTKATSLLLQEETLQLDAAGLEGTTVKHFYQIEELSILDSTGADFTTGTITITSQPDGYETVFNLNDDEPPRYTIEAELAEVPVRYYGMLARQVTYNFGAPNSIDVDFVGTRMDEERTIEGGNAIQYAGQGTRAQNPDDFPFVTRRILPSWGGYLILDGQALLFEGMTLTFNNNWQFSEGRQAERFQEDVERQQRIIGASFNVYFYVGTAAADRYTRWQTLFRERQGFDVRASGFHFPGSGRQYELRVDMVNMILNAPVAINIADRGRVTRTVEATAFRSGGSAVSNNAVITWRGEDQWS